MTTPGETHLELAWQPEPSMPWLGDVMLGAAGSVYGELPNLRMRPPGGDRSATRQVAADVTLLSTEDQARLVNPDAVLAQQRLGVPEAERAVVVLVDGLGWHNLQARPDRAPFLTTEMTSVVGRSTIPSTTAANITFLGTGSHPGQTAMAGYTVRNPSTGKRVNLISWTGGPDPLEWQRVPTIFERLGNAGAQSAHVSTWRFESSALTRAALRGATYLAAESLPERVDATIDLMTSTDTRLAYLYWAEIDAVGHRYGWQTQEWESELKHLDGEVNRLISALPPKTLVILTSDHGMLDVPLTGSRVFGGPSRIDISAHRELSSEVELVAGENRFLHLFTPNPVGVAARWRAFLGERAVVRERAEAFANDMFGPVRSDVADVIGDVTVALLGDISVADRSVVSEEMFNLAGLHGSVTEWERAVPILWTLTG